MAKIDISSWTCFSWEKEVVELGLSGGWRVEVEAREEAEGSLDHRWAAMV